MIYAVNKRTKEHRVISDATRYGAEEWRYVDADPDGWIEWQGGECPLPDDCFVQIKTNIGIPNEGRADEFRWARQSRHGDIVAYRPILDAKVSHPGTMSGPDKYRAAGGEAPAWDGDGLPPVGARIEVRRNDNDWPEVTVVAHDDGRVIFRDPECSARYKWAIAGGLRPIRSEEDRAVEGIVAIAEHEIEKDGSVANSTQIERCLGAVYAAIRDGKVPGVKLTGGGG